MIAENSGVSSGPIAMNSDAMPSEAVHSDAMPSESDQIRSVQFIDNYFPVIDGVTETVHHYARLMPALVVCPEMERDYLSRQAFPYPVRPAKTLRIPLSRYASAVPLLDRRLPSAVVDFAPAVFHVHSPSLLGDYASRLGRKLGIPVVATFHSKYYDAIYEFTKSRAISRFATSRIVALYDRCDEVWACSEETGETLRSYGYRKPYFVMPNGANVSFPANAAELKALAADRFGFPSGRHILLFVGQQIWYKNQRLLLDAFRRLCPAPGSSAPPSFFLVMVGTGKDEREIARYAASLGLSDQEVCFTGQIRDRDLLRGVYLNADLLFFPSVFDNAPLVLREAAALGVPTLAVEGSNAAAPIVKNVSGFTAAATPEAMAAEILRIFAREDLPRVGRSARETIPLSWEALIPRVLARYRVVAERVRQERLK